MAVSQLPPSPPLPEGQHSLLARAGGRGLPDRALPPLAAPPGGSWLLLRLAGPWQRPARRGVAQVAGHLEDAAVGHQRGVKGLKALASCIWEWVC